MSRAAIGQGAPIRLSTTEFEACWDVLGLGELPHVLDLPSPGGTVEERRRLLEEVRSGLRARGLADGQGMHPDLAGLLATLCRYSWAVDAWLALDRPVRALGAQAGRVGALAVLDDAECSVHVRSVPSGAVLGEVVACLPELPPPSCPVDAVRVPADVLDAALAAAGGADPLALADELLRLGERPATAHAVARLAEGTGWQGQFGVTVTDGFGRRRRAAEVVGFHDTRAARVMHLRRNGWVTLTRAGHDHLVRALRELLDRTGQ
ncbi:ESX secretion-associated protein EspG [Gandjariella thermophila]|uniref:ESX secretion-associated protein EspG n=1 Tax=Gandjariella thermophila TaxID=1931992 RepID=A0A4D4J1T4_9PSEU|nr:ESX secretion-associated protein EspG [Gandjariella thermophila]GDY30441.1 ESX secretion-associated protein EspG [Gandjariella thermophila]